MNAPYKTAWELWHEQPCSRVLPWDDLLTWFFHYGAAVITEDAFLLARPLPVDAPDDVHNQLLPPEDALQFPTAANCWNVWLAVGRLDFLAVLASRRPMPWVSFCRHNQARVRRYPLQLLLRKYDHPENAATTAAATAACDQHRPGTRHR